MSDDELWCDFCGAEIVDLTRRRAHPDVPGSFLCGDECLRGYEALTNGGATVIEFPGQ